MADAALVEALRRELAAREGVRLALLFGSRARGTGGPSSDVDLAVLGDVDRLRLAAELSRALRLEVNVVGLDAPPLVLLRHVLRDAVCVREDAPGAWGRFLARSLVELENDGPAIDRMSAAFLRHVARDGILPAGK